MFFYLSNKENIMAGYVSLSVSAGQKQTNNDFLIIYVDSFSLSTHTHSHTHTHTLTQSRTHEIQVRKQTKK